MPIKRTVSDTKFRSAKPKAKPYKLADEGGLYMEVRTNGSKSWRFKYRTNGFGDDGRAKRVEKLLTIGPYPEIDLATARQKRDEARASLANGIEPVSQRKAAKEALEGRKTFQWAAEQWLEHWAPNKSPRYVEYTRRRLEQNVFPAIGAVALEDLKAMHIVAVMKALDGRGVGDLAKRAKETSGQIMRWAVAHGHAETNPAAMVKPADVLRPTKTVNHARLDEKQLPELLRKIEAYQGQAMTRYALKLMALTFVRTSELINARWSEFDLDAEQWRIPAERMKMRAEHIVPLSRQAMQLLSELRYLSGHSELLFYGERDHRKPMSNNTILMALKRMGFAGRMTGHGFRGIASTVLHEANFDHMHIELQLAHQERDQVSAAYNFAKYLPQRAAMMQFYADFLDAKRTGATVIPFKRTG
jgi:integrase